MQKKDKLSNEDIERIFSMHKKGISQCEIGRCFDVDHSTIHYHLFLRKKIIKSSEKSKNKRIEKYKKFKGINDTNSIGEKICVGKSYIEYLKAAKVKKCWINGTLYRLSNKMKRIIPTSEMI